MRIMQVEAFYPAALDKFYARFPHMAAASWREQTAALLADGFSAGHNIVPYLDTLGYEPHFIIANCAPTQMAWMNEHGLPFPQEDAMYATLRRQIETIRPDVLYFSDALAFESNFIRSLSFRPRLIMGWHAAPLPDRHDWSEFDVILSGLEAMRIMARLLGAKAAAHFMPGIPAWVPQIAAGVEEAHDILFAGSCNPGQHHNRNLLLAELGEHATRHAYDCAFHLTSTLPVQDQPAILRWYQPPVFANEMIATLAGGRIVFDSRSTMAGRAPDGVLYDLAGGETSNMRIFEATGAGAFLLTEHFDNLSTYFEVGSEIETFKTRDELLEKIDFFLRNPERRHEIAKAGQARCIADYSMEKRAVQFDAIIRQHLA